MQMNKKVTVGMKERAAQLNSLLLAQGAGFEVDYISVWKNNRKIDGYVLKSKYYNCVPTIYYDDNWYQKSDEEVVDYLKQSVEKYSCQLDVTHFLSKDYILSHILPRVVASHNKDDLQKQEIVYTRFLDMCVVFYIPLDSFCGDDGIGSFQMTNRIMEQIGITLNEMYNASVHNLEAQIELKNMSEVLGYMMDEEEAEKFDLGYCPMWVCTNKSKIYGAATMLCPSVLCELKKKIGEQYVILPSSIHEIIAIPYDDTTDQAKEYASMVREINNTQVRIEDRLTDSVYIVRNQTIEKV